ALGVKAAALASIVFGADSVFDSAALARIIEKNIDFERVRERADRSRLLLNTVDLQSGAAHVFDNAVHDAETLRGALLASASEPVFMPPVDLKGADGKVVQHVDGGVRELIPLA